MRDDEIQTLVGRAQAGDASAFDLLYREYVQRVYGFFRFRLATDDTAEDLTQRLFLKMIEQLPAYRNRGLPFGAWLFRMARNMWIDDYRRKREMDTLESLADRPSEDGDPESLAVTAMEWDRVDEALRHLPHDQQEVIAARFFAGLTPKETAAQMGRSEGSVRVLQHRALIAIRRRMRIDVPASGAVEEVPS
jgi:RNA polymerase sigma-70 factor, ECF subfamily